MRTGNAILDVLVRVVAIALITAIIVWILGVLHAPTIVGTVIWVLALLVIAGVIFPLVTGGAGLGRGGPADRPAEPTASSAPPRTDDPTAETRRPPPAA
jgi:hypothetical protein